MFIHYGLCQAASITVIAAALRLSVWSLPPERTSTDAWQDAAATATTVEAS